MAGGVHSHWQRQHEAVAVREACLWVLSQHPLGHWPPTSPLHSLSSPKAQEPAQAPCLKQTLGAEHRPEGTRPLARLAWVCQYTRRVSPALRHQPHGLSPPHALVPTTFPKSVWYKAAATAALWRFLPHVPATVGEGAVFR